MDSEEDNTHDMHDDADGGVRPLGYWLRTVETLLHREFATAFGDEGVSRREWMLLNAVAGAVNAPGFTVGGKGMRRLEQRGWVEEAGDGTWILTDEGRTAKKRLGAVVEGIRSRVAGAVPPEDFATTLASLEAIARELGWDENERMPRPWFGRGFGRGFDRGFGRDFGPGFGPGYAGHDIPEGFDPSRRHGFRPGFGPGFGPGGGPTAMPDDASWRAPQHGYGHGHDHRGHDDHGHDDRGHSDRGHGDRGHGHDQQHGHRHGDHGYGCGDHRRSHGQHGQHSQHGHHGLDAESAYERGFDAGYRRGQTAS